MPWTHWTVSDDPRDWLAAAAVLINVVLVVITGLYVLFTRRIMAAALRQAEASVVQTSAMQEQARAASRMAEIALDQIAAERRRILLPLQLAVASALSRVETWRQAAEQPNAVDQFVSNLRNFEDPMFSPEFGRVLELAAGLSPAAAEAMQAAAGEMKEMDRYFALIKRNVDQAGNFNYARLRTLLVIRHLKRAQEIVGVPAS